jgi:hypothetical protein
VLHFLRLNPPAAGEEPLNDQEELTSIDLFSGMKSCERPAPPDLRLVFSLQFPQHAGAS